jgi:hypothetical protein
LISCTLQEQQPPPPQQRMRLWVRKQQPQQQGSSSCTAAKGSICFMQLPGKAHIHDETCAAMALCVKSGGAGLVVYQTDKSAEPDAFYLNPGSQLDCGPQCKCWNDLKASLGCSDMDSCSGKVLPGVIISPKHAAALKTAAAGTGGVNASIAAFEYPYKYFDGTSMSAPHVSGAAALIWRQFPRCKAADIANALKMSAQRLPGQTQVPDYAGGYGMLKVDMAYEWIKKNNPCAQGDDAGAA